MTTLLEISDFMEIVTVKNFENRPLFDKVMCRILRLTFLAHPARTSRLENASGGV